MSVTERISLEHADRLYRCEDDVERAVFSVDLDTIVAESLAATGIAAETTDAAGICDDRSEQHRISVSSLPADSLWTVVSRK